MIDSWFVIVMGFGTVLIGLTFIVLLCKILNLVCLLFLKTNEAATSTAISDSGATLSPELRSEIIACISAAIAEENQTTEQGIRIISIKRVR